MAIRVDAAGRSAAAIADFLADQPGITRVWYPTRPDHPQHALARQQMSGGGTVVTFEVAGGKPGAFKVMNGFELIAVSNNLGDSKSLATHPATTTHMRIGEQERARLGITDGVIRVSIGLEDVEDIKDDLRQALDGRRWFQRRSCDRSAVAMTALPASVQGPVAARIAVLTEKKRPESSWLRPITPIALRNQPENARPLRSSFFGRSTPVPSIASSSCLRAV